MQSSIAICRYLDAVPSPRLEASIDEIFFEASNTKSFADAGARAAFRDRWLGRYLRNDPQYAYLACAPSGDVVGYLVGTRGAMDERGDGEANGIALFRDLARRFPAHLHVNVSPAYRGFGSGSRLIEAFIADVKQVGAVGVHVITSAGSHNVRFYNRNGFMEVGRGGPNDMLVVLAKPLP